MSKAEVVIGLELELKFHKRVDETERQLIEAQMVSSLNTAIQLLEEHQRLVDYADNLKCDES
jgi:hypothetical protein